MKKAKQTTYWSSDMDKHIVLYNTASSDAEKQRIYEDKIYQPLVQLAAANLACHRSNENVLEYGEALIADMVSVATTKLPLYKNDKKSFSYFNTICRNQLWQTCIKAYNKSLKSTSLDAMLEDEDGEASQTHVCLSTNDDKNEDEQYRAILCEYWNRYITVHTSGIGQSQRAAVMILLNELVYGDFRPDPCAPKKTLFAHMHKKWVEGGYQAKWHNNYVGRGLSLIQKVNQKIYQKWVNDPDYFRGDYKAMVVTERNTKLDPSLRMTRRGAANYYARNRTRVLEACRVRYMENKYAKEISENTK